MDWKIISFSVVATVFLALVSQLVYTLVASAIGIASAHSELEFFSTYKEQMWFLTAVAAYCLTMVLSGLMTSYLSDSHFILNSSVAGGIAGSLILLSSLGMGPPTLMSGSMPVFGFIFAALGGYLWTRRVNS